MIDRSHLGYIDGLRGLSALYVTACHAYLTYAVLFLGSPQGDGSDFLLRSMSWLGYGRSAVAVFIVVSGYCLMLPALQSSDGQLRGGTLGFLRRRARRILPPYYAAMLLSLTLIAAVPGLREQDQSPWREACWKQVFPAWTPGVILSHVFLVHNYHRLWQHAIDYPMWSLATEWQIYVLFPLLMAIWRRRSMGDAVMCALRITFGLQVLLMLLPWQVNPWPPQFIALFAFGMAAASATVPGTLRDRSNRPPQWIWRPLSVLLFGAYVLVEATIGPWLLASGHQQAQDLLIGGAAACLMVECTCSTHDKRAGLPVRILSSRLLTGLGAFSYSLYLVHAPILAWVFVVLQAWGIPNVWVQVLMLGAGIPISLIAAYLFSLAFERPFLRAHHARAAIDRFPDGIAPGLHTATCGLQDAAVS